MPSAFLLPLTVAALALAACLSEAEPPPAGGIPLPADTVEMPAAVAPPADGAASERADGIARSARAADGTPGATTSAGTPGVATPDTLRSPLPGGFVRLSEVAPSIALEIRYTTPYNFVGEPIDGYLAPECILTTRAAEALRYVAEDLARVGLGLKVYDCYRPQQAVDHFIRWIRRPDDQAMKTAFYPTEPKLKLVRHGYISTRSGHSRGSTVDLTLLRLPAGARVRTRFPAFDEAPRCDAPAGERLDERDLDMGTAYDCLSPLATTASTAVSEAAQENRQTLRAAMSRRGFRNYAKEWWHFTLRNEPESTLYDFPVD